MARYWVDLLAILPTLRQFLLFAVQYTVKSYPPGVIYHIGANIALYSMYETKEK